MKIDLNSIDRLNFKVAEKQLNNELVYLVTPLELSTPWDSKNSICRSSIWTKDGEPINLSWKKFVNIGEKPKFEPIDYSKPITYVRKLDGSAAPISKRNGNIIFRTRNTVEAKTTMENGYEVDFLINKYPRLFNNSIINSENFTILCEWTTPTNIICLKESEEPELWLTGIVRHEDYGYLSQKTLDELAIDFGVKRPETYTFNAFEEAVKFAQDSTKIEGLVLYCNDGQVLKKAKSLSYLRLHSFKSNISFKNLAELYFNSGCNTKQEFEAKIETELDHECKTMALPVIEELFSKISKANETIKDLEIYVSNLKHLPRRDAALNILTHKKELSNLCFALLDGKQPDIKKMIL